MHYLQFRISFGQNTTKHPIGIEMSNHHAVAMRQHIFVALCRDHLVEQSLDHCVRGFGQQMFFLEQGQTFF